MDRQTSIYDRLRYDTYYIIAYSLFCWPILFLGWILFVTIDHIGCFVSNCSNNNGFLPWHYTNYAIIFYFMLFCTSIVATTYNTLCKRSTKYTKKQRIFRRLFIMLMTPVFLNMIFWDPFITYVAKGKYLDATIPIVPYYKHNISSSDIVVIGNGPISDQQRSIIMTVNQSNVYRFNGMSTLHPDDVVGNLFARKIKDNSAPNIGIGDFHGLNPPNQLSHVLDTLYNPWSHEISRRGQCDRIRDVNSIELLFGNETDAVYYKTHQNVPVSVSLFPDHARNTMLKYGKIFHPERLSSGGIVILGALDRFDTKIHTFGMNFGKLANRHPIDYERYIINMNLNRITIHPTPTNTYHDFITPNSWYRRDPRIRGFACGEWNVLWLDETRFNPKWWAFGMIPMPPFFND